MDLRKDLPSYFNPSQFSQTTYITYILHKQNIDNIESFTFSKYPSHTQAV